MRDIITIGIFVIGAFYGLKRPYIAMCLWVWIGVMNPHRQGWGIAYDLPFAQAAFVLTLLAIPFSRQKLRFPTCAPPVLLILFMLWMSLTVSVAIVPGEATEGWIRMIKTQIMVIVALFIITEYKHIQAVLWTIVVSLAYYGAKGGLFTIKSGGGEKVWGPPDSLINGNNEIAVALIMSVPLMYYLSTHLTKKWQKWAMYGAMLLTSISALGSQSRGALLASCAMGLMLWVKSKHKMRMFIIFLCFVPWVLAFMPASYWERMNTMKTYEQDSSAMGRINAWTTAFNIAKDRITGAGFGTDTMEVFGRYSPEPHLILVAHSIYFQVMGDHGFIGLGLFLSIFATTFFMAGRLKRLVGDNTALYWARDLGQMIQVSLVGFAVGGAFLSLAYWDVPYYLMVLTVATTFLVKREQGTAAKAQTPTSPLVYNYGN